MDPSYPASTSTAPSCLCSWSLTATWKVLLPTKQKFYGGDWFSWLWVSHITTNPSFLTLCCASAYHPTGMWGSHPLWPRAALPMCTTPHQGFWVQGWQRMERKSRTCSISLLSEQWGLRSHMSCSFVSCVLGHCCPRLEHCGLLLCCSLWENLYFSGLDRLKVLFCLSSHFMFWNW